MVCTCCHRGCARWSSLTFSLLGDLVGPAAAVPQAESGGRWAQQDLGWSDRSDVWMAAALRDRLLPDASPSGMGGAAMTSHRISSFGS